MSPRRIRWTFRLVLYGGLALIAAALIAARPGDRLILTGKTTQGEFFDMQTDTDGTVTAFQTHLRAACGGDWWQISWTPADEQPVPFERDGEWLEVREEWERELGDGSIERGWAELDGYVADDGRSVDGVMDAAVTFTRGGERYARCTAFDVEFRAKTG